VSANHAAGGRVVLRGVVQYEHPIDHLAWIRRRANTTTSAITHGVYDLILFGLLAAGSTI
jgi:hypothetical protein